MAEEREEAQGGIDGRFFRLIATFEAAAMQQLGKIASPVTGDVEIHLDGARDSIDMLDMIRAKTEGNLNEDERRLLDHVLYQLRMNYVDVARAEQPDVARAEQPDDATGQESSEAQPGSADEGSGSSSAEPGDGADS